MELLHRPRRLRRTALIRDLCAETRMNLDGLIQAYFVCDGDSVKDRIDGLPGIYRESVDSLVKSVEADIALGINKIMLFGVVDRKDQMASTATDEKNPVLRAVRELKGKHGDDLFIAADVCLCAYTDTGHCGVTVDGLIDNDKSVEVLSGRALSRAGWWS